MLNSVKSKYSSGNTVVRTFIVLLILSGITFSQSGWFQLNSGTSEDFRSITFTDDNTGYAVGRNGTIRKTTDAGNNWFAQISPETVDIRSVCFTNINVGYISLNSTNIAYKTLNGGNNWNNINSSSACGSQPPIGLCIFFQNNNTGYIGRPCGRIAKTTNGGLNWITIVTTLEDYIYSIYFSSELTGYAAGSYFGYSGHVLKTTDAGNNWFDVLSYSNNAGFMSIHFADANTGMAVGGFYNAPDSGYGIIFRTTDAGLTWTNLNFNNGNTNFLWSVKFVSQAEGYIVGKNFSPNPSSIILKTTNSGINWYSQSTGLVDALTSIYFTSLNTGYVVGRSGKILKTTDGGGYIGIQPLSGELPTSYMLEQNYPNPFNPTTKISFSMPISSFAILKVYDLLGREVATLVNEQLKPGSYEVDLNAVNYPSGVYYYRLDAGSYSETKKMILIK